MAVQRDRVAVLRQAIVRVKKQAMTKWSVILQSDSDSMIRQACSLKANNYKQLQHLIPSFLDKSNPIDGIMDQVGIQMAPPFIQCLERGEYSQILESEVVCTLINTPLERRGPGIKSRPSNKPTYGTTRSASQLWSINKKINLLFLYRQLLDQIFKPSTV